jgi:zinc protease
MQLDMSQVAQALVFPSLTQGVRQTTLTNGLTVLTKEVHTAPVVTVQVWYQVGARNEPAGWNGLSHQLEHLLFKGTYARPIQFGRLFSALGSDSNAFTSYDQTAYFNTVERDKLKALLILEADRMCQVQIDEERLASEKGVVISELQGYENDPGYRLDRAVMRTAFPEQPYGLPVGGTRADVEQFTVAQVEQYYRTYYRPENATLVIVGDFETESTLNAVTEIFGHISASPSPLPLSSQTEVELRDAAHSAPILLQEPGSAPLLQIVYPLPNIQHPDVPALQLLDLILTEGRNSRLELSLVESGLASQMNSYPANLKAGGWYSLWVTAAPDQSLETIDQALLQTLQTLQETGVTEEELQRARRQLLAAVVLWSRDINSQAMQLGNNQTTAGDYHFSDRFLQAIAQVSAVDVQRVAQRYLDPQKRTVGFFKPTQPDGEVGIVPRQATQTVENFSAGPPVDPAEVAQYLPSIDGLYQPNQQSLPERLVLPNGLQILLLADPSTPTVTFSGHIRAGSEFDTLETAGLANLTAENLVNGTARMDALTLAQTLDDRGADLEFNANREGVFISGNAINTDLPVLIDVLSDILQNATFPEEELELSRQQALTSLQMNLDDPARLARQVFQQTLYPADHPFYSFSTATSLQAITRHDLVAFYRTYYRPETTVLTLVGDFDPVTVRSRLEQQLGHWSSPDMPLLQSAVPPISRLSSTRLSKVLPGKAQTVTLIGHHGIDRQDLRFYAAILLNHILGGDTLASRLGTEIRDRQGLTYGIYSYFQTGLYAGPFLIEMQTAPEQREQAISSTLTLLQQVHDQGVTAAELGAAQRTVTSSYSVELAHPDNLATTLLMNTVYGLDLEEIQQFPQKIQATTLEQVNQAAQELLHPQQLVVVSAGPQI